MRFYFQAENGFTELKYHGQASRLPYYNDGTVYGEYSTPGGEAITQTTGDDYAFGEYVYTAPADILVPFDTNYTIMDEQSSTKITLLCSDAEVIAPGTLVQLVYFKNDDDEWTPTDKDGKPWNYSNWVILQSNAQYFDHLDVYGKRYKHTYDMEEALTCFKDYPVRSSKTFAGGRYTYREVLDITLRLFLKPRVHDSTFVIKDNPLLDEPNSKLSYTNATVFDVVSDIGRILDVTPNVEVKYEDSKYVYYLEYLPNYGTIGEEVDISYFNLANADTETSTRDTHAGAVISNVQNLVTDEGTSYPAPGIGLYPGVTNISNQIETYNLPMPIKSIEEIRVYHRFYFLDYQGDVYDSISYWHGKAKENIGWVDDFKRDNRGEVLYDINSPLIITENGSYAKPFSLPLPNTAQIEETSSYGAYYKTFGVGGTAIGTPIDENAMQLFVASKNIEKFLYDELPDKTMQQKYNTIFYDKGGTTVDLSALLRAFFLVGRIEAGGSNSRNLFAKFADTTTELLKREDAELDQTYVHFSIRPLIEIKYNPYISNVIKEKSDIDSPTTVFFNQYGQVVSAEAFGNAISNYADEMSGSSRIVGKIAEPVGEKSFYDLYRELPQVGCTVVDHERNKRYVLSQLSVTRQPQSLDILAQLNERKKGRSQVVQADNQQYLAQIPDSDVQESKTLAHFTLKLSTMPIAKKHTEDIQGENMVELLLNPVLQDKLHKKGVVMDFISSNSIVAIPTNATTKESIYFSFRFLDNRFVGSANDETVLYTDRNGEIDEVVLLLYNTADMATTLSNYPYFTTPSDTQSHFALFSINLKKDAYEQTNITIQMSVKPCGSLLLGRGYIDKTPFGKKASLYDEELKILFFNHPVDGVDLSNPVLSTTASAFWERINNRNEILLWWDDQTPTHKAWALLSGEDVLLFCNEPIKETANVQEAILYFDLSLEVL